MENSLSNARLLSKSLESTGWYRCVSDVDDYKKGEVASTVDGETSADYNASLPVVALCLTDEFKQNCNHSKQVSVSNLLRAKRYIIPNYPLPPNAEKTDILRVVFRKSMPLVYWTGKQFNTDIITRSHNTDLYTLSGW